MHFQHLNPATHSKCPDCKANVSLLALEAHLKSVHGYATDAAKYTKDQHVRQSIEAWQHDVQNALSQR